MNANFLQDSQGNNSSTRLIAALWFLGVLAAWGFLVIANKAMPELPQTVLGLLGICAGWLVANKHVETNAPQVPDAPKP